MLFLVILCEEKIATIKRGKQGFDIAEFDVINYILTDL